MAARTNGKSGGLTDDGLRNGLRGVFESPNVPDANLQPANVVDVIQHLALQTGQVAKGLGDIAKAIDRLAKATAYRGEDY
jgi:hypothetical protein